MKNERYSVGWANAAEVLKEIVERTPIPIEMPAALPIARYMVQVWEHGHWCDYWPTENRRNARGVLKPFWRSKRWRVIDRGEK